MIIQKNLNWINLIIICCLITICSCAPQIPIAKFETLKESSESVLANTIDTYSRIEKLQRRFSIITAPDSEIDRNTFKPIIEGQSFDLTPELRFREAAFDVLVTYTVVLHSLSSKNYMAKVDKSSQQLAGSINNLIETSEEMKGVDAAKASGIFATLVNTISREIVKQKRMNALKQVMDLAQDDLEKVSKLIVGSNVKIKSAVGIMLNRIIAHANVARPAYGTAERYPFDFQIAEIITGVEDIESSLETMNTAISKIPEAHKEIRNGLDKKQTSLQALQLLVKEAQRANKFYRNVTK